ncbi:MAG: formate--phosphoribosylaminoimidazolecarboxamide ligase [Euryarchaeota archaeon]|nr:formate--phosphoribosylaminoimidazolecarboxamide ligase [Euryarchaeota archaeon]
MVPRGSISGLLSSYDPKRLAVATVCSHTSLQIFDGARREGFRTIGICIGQPPRFYDAFPKAKPDMFFSVKSYKEIPARAAELASMNAVVVPHGSFVEYLGVAAFEGLRLPTFGNRRVLKWESDRDKQREWLVGAGLSMPEKIARPEDITKPVLVKFYGAKGGRGFFIAKNYEEFMEVNPTEKHTIQEYVIGTRYYMHFFYSPLVNRGYRLSRGSLELMSMDRRDEANIDEMYKLGAQERLKQFGILPTFVVTGNVPVVLRESLLPKAFWMGERTVERSFELFGGIIGPFSLECIVTDKLEFKVFEISARIVAGTNFFVRSSPYSDLREPEMSVGRRIAREMRLARRLKRLDAVLS